MNGEEWDLKLNSQEAVDHVSSGTSSTVLTVFFSISFKADEMKICVKPMKHPIIICAKMPKTDPAITTNTSEIQSVSRLKYAHLGCEKNGIYGAKVSKNPCLQHSITYRLYFSLCAFLGYSLEFSDLHWALFAAKYVDTN